VNDIRRAKEGMCILEAIADICPGSNGPVNFNWLMKAVSDNKISLSAANVQTSDEFWTVCIRGSSTPSAVPPAPFNMLAKRGSRPKM
jgi:hypothetical protein